MFIYDHCGTLKYPHKSAGHEVPGVVAVLCESLGMGGYRERDMPRMGLSVPFAYHLALRCKSCKTNIIFSQD